MIGVPPGVRVWIATGHTDMRRGMNSLALQVQEALKRDPHGGDLYVFRGKSGKLIKILWHDGLGMSLYAKRLERGRFIWPSPADGVFPSLPRNSATCSKAFRNIPSGESDESLAEVIQVLDPRHPLHGRSFRVIRRSAHRAGNFPASYEVEYRNGVSLLVPISVTELYVIGPNQTKLSIESLRELRARQESTALSARLPGWIV